MLWRGIDELRAVNDRNSPFASVERIDKLQIVGKVLQRRGRFPCALDQGDRSSVGILERTGVNHKPRRRIGGDFGGTATFSGLIDDVRISEGALAPSEFMKADERTEEPPGLMIKLI